MLIATFDSNSAARQAARILELKGLAADAIRIDLNDTQVLRGPDSPAGGDEPTGTGPAVVCATVPENMIESATEILSRFGALLGKPPAHRQG